MTDPAALPSSINHLSMFPTRSIALQQHPTTSPLVNQSLTYLAKAFLSMLFLLLCTTDIAIAAAPVPQKADTVWMLLSSVLVILMCIPGLALFYGGLVRTKNMLSILMQIFSIFCLIGVLWALYGYSLAFTEHNAFIGNFSKALLSGVAISSTVATFSKGVVISEYIYIVFQMTFAAISCALIVGAFAERARFSAVLLFVALWFTFAYLPIAHMVWFWAGPDAYVSEAAAHAADATAGWLFQKGALDFAGGTVVHINSAVAGLVGAYFIGKRIGYRKEAMAPHNLTLTMVGAAMLWFGWFGFNAGSNLEANDTAILAVINTLFAACTAACTWMSYEWFKTGKPSMLGIVSGCISGLVAITPACGFVGPLGALAIGASAGLAGFWGVNGLKRILGVDDALDVFGIHGVCGIVGALLTGIFAAPSLGGVGLTDYVTNTVKPYSIIEQLIAQGWGVTMTILWSGLVSWLAYWIADTLLGLRVTEEEEREGLDIRSHGEAAYSR